MAAKKVRARLLELKWTHVELAEAMAKRGAPVASGLISHWLKGRNAPDILRGTVLDEVLGINVAKLWGSAKKGRAA